MIGSERKAIRNAKRRRVQECVMRRDVVRILCASLTTADILIAAGTTPSRAADMSYRPNAPYTVNQPLNMYSWAGPYIGGNLGYGWGTVTNNGAEPSGVQGGIQGGYNWQFNQLVVGAEADLQLSGASDTFAAWKFNNPWFGTVRGRAGYAVNNMLFYATGGLAFGTLHATSFGLSESRTSAGWTVGAGAEVGLTQNWSARFEYLYIDLSSSPFALTGVQNGYHANTVRLGVNYRF